MSLETSKETGRGGSSRGLYVLLACLVGVLVFMFFDSFLPGKVVWSNDGPYGAISTKAGRLPQGVMGGWDDLNWLGNELMSAAPSFTTAVAIVFRPLGYAKFAAPVCFLLVGFSAWLLFRQLKFTPLACVLGGLAAALNSCFFSTGCWGVVSQPVCFAACYCALAAVADRSAPHPWWRLVLAGFAVGWGIMEAFDVGAIFSLFVAAFVLFQSLNTDEPAPVARKLGSGVLRVAIVAICAAIIACQTVSALVATQIKNVTAASQDKGTRQNQWDFATVGSLPKKEVLQIIVPGIFGYRTDTPDGGSYWGAINQSPQIDELLERSKSSDDNVRSQASDTLKQLGLQNPGVFRQTGSGLYAGVPVVLIALWAVFQAFRRNGSPFSILQRRFVWFWTALAIIALLLGFGRNAPLYQFFYALPYTSAMRQPFKFLHVFNWALLILFAYGVDGICRTFMLDPVARAKGLLTQFRAWWKNAPAFDRVWVAGCFVALGIGFLAWMIYASSEGSLESYLQKVGFPDPKLAHATARFSLVSVGWFLLFLALTTGLLALIMSGQFNAARARWGGILLGSLLLFDLVRADLPWVYYWDLDYMYADNPILQKLAVEPWEDRVILEP